MTAKLSDLIDFVRKLHDLGELSRVELDTILVLTDAFEKQLPTRFKDLVRRFDKAFDGDPYSDSFLFLDRLINIYDTSKILPEDSTSKINIDELTPTFSLSPEETEKVLELCAKMRKIVLSTIGFDEPHKLRILNRIAAMEAEVHRKKGRFDVVLAGVVDVGETLGKFGKSIKPLTKRMTEIAKITRSKTKAYNQIPAPDDVKQIEDKSGDD